MTTSQFNRFYRLRIKFIDGTDVLDTTSLRVVFEVSKNLSSIPNQATITIFNLSRDTEKKMASGDEMDIILTAGYETEYDILLEGAVRTVSSEIQDGVDRSLNIITGDGDLAIRFGTIRQTFGGSLPLEYVIQAIVDTLPRVSVGIINGVLGKRTPTRGLSLSGDSRTILNRLGRQYDFTWSIQDGILETVSIDKTKSTSIINDMGTEAFIISPETGMIGTPSFQDNNKILVRSLLNARIKPGRVIQIKSKVIQAFWKVISITFLGDSSGQNWYMDIEGLQIDQAIL